jgi:hypothetical protein
MKVVSYLLMVFGIGVLALSVPPVNEFVGGYLSFIKGVNNFVLIGVGLVLVLAGLLTMKNSRGKKLIEVPIYQGKNIVGYRRD